MNPAQATLYAEYNQWMNEKIYGICADFSEEELKKDRGAFFKSIHGTLDHILLGDRAWFGRFIEEPFQFKSLDQLQYEDFAELRQEREAMDKRILEWAMSLTQEQLEAEFCYESRLFPGTRSCPLWTAVTHFFNHQTHHRGQVTTLLFQMGIDPGVTDMVMMPGAVTEV
jgi:uncharacterized damage-inducible protein DinB